MTEGLFTCSDDCRTWYTSLPRTTAGRGWTVRTEVGAKIDAHAERIGFGYMRLLLEAASSPLVVDAALLVGISKRSMVHGLWGGVSSENNDEAQDSDKDSPDKNAVIAALTNGPWPPAKLVRTDVGSSSCQVRSWKTLSCVHKIDDWPTYLLQPGSINVAFRLLPDRCEEKETNIGCHTFTKCSSADWKFPKDPAAVNRSLSEAMFSEAREKACAKSIRFAEHWQVRQRWRHL
jgi:hypothetical protein